MVIDYGFDREISYVVGIDEVGWGAIAGPLYVGGCVVSVEDDLEWCDVKDSKKYSTELAREVVYTNLLKHQFMEKRKLDFVTWSASAEEVSRNPGLALHRLQEIVVAILTDDLDAPFGVIIDGKSNVGFPATISRAVPKADSLYKVVSCASVVAKVERDRFMRTVAENAPEYAFETNKGYPTKQHLNLLAEFGPSRYHRTNITCVQNASVK